MNTSLELHTHKLPEISEIISDLEASAKDDILNVLLGNEPPAAWVMAHPMLTVVVGEKDGKKIYEALKYIPIDKQRFLGKRLFGVVKTEILREGVMFQSCYATVRIHYKNPVSGEWLFHDGTGAVGVQTDKGESAADLSKIKSDAVQKALPAAAAYAEKNAWDKFGRLFGGEIQKKARQFTENETVFAKMFYDNPSIEDVKGLYEMKKEALSPAEIKDCERIINNNETASFKKIVNLLQSK